MRLKEKNTLKSECNLIVQSFFHNVKKTAGKKKSIKMKSYYCFRSRLKLNVKQLIAVKERFDVKRFR